MKMYSKIPNSGITYRIEYSDVKMRAVYYDRQFQKIEEAKARLERLKNELGDGYIIRLVKYTKNVELMKEIDTSQEGMNHELGKVQS